MSYLPPNNFETAVEYLFNQLPIFSRQGEQALNPSLTKTKLLCAGMNHPEKSIRTVHIAGTNGKGSTSHIIAAIFQQAGYKTGLYTSPHLIDLRERIRIDGKMMEKESLVAFLQEYWPEIQEIKPSYFELNVAMAFWYFAKKEVDIAIIETGLGGRWDSTNVIVPELSIITNISLDHTQILGNTLAAIAEEKAGIIKEGIPVVIGKTQEETNLAFSKAALLNHTSLVYADLLFDGIKMAGNEHSQTIKYVDKSNLSVFEIETDLLGSFQIENIRTALAATKLLKQQGWNLGLTIEKKALAQVKKLTGLRGRWDLIKAEPLVIADVAHNPAGLAMIAKQLENFNFESRKLHIIVGFVADKDVKEALSFLPKHATYYLTQATIPRALPVLELAIIASDLELKFYNYPTVHEAVLEAEKNASQEDVILITGSFFIVGEALALVSDGSV